MTHFEASGVWSWHQVMSCFLSYFKLPQSFHISWNITTHNHIKTYTLLHINTRKNSKQNHKHYHYTQSTVDIWQVLRLQMEGLWKKVWVVFVILLIFPYTVNMTWCTSLQVISYNIANWHQLGCSESVISQCPLCPIKLSTEFSMPHHTWIICPSLEQGWLRWM